MLDCPTAALPWSRVTCVLVRIKNLQTPSLSFRQDWFVRNNIFYSPCPTPMLLFCSKVLISIFRVQGFVNKRNHSNNFQYLIENYLTYFQYTILKRKKETGNSKTVTAYTSSTEPTSIQNQTAQGNPPLARNLESQFRNSSRRCVPNPLVRIQNCSSCL